MSTPLKPQDISVGQELPHFDMPLDATRIVAGAIASRDYMPVHHDRDYATSQGAPDIFMNILTTNGYISRFVTDWAGPECQVRNIVIRLGVPAIPGHTLKFRGQVKECRVEASETMIELEIQAATELGDHATGSVTLSLPNA